ncbi:heterokaryon incompatibility protein-domain-containing protein [Dactylonectria macrodidyma]|uniref:Heterokaryon incompatibility protein-domain-containing protein n=1 Tax=Dactylonectria macrodidyma TaxID=307937 RepID=A0A9P9FLP2_9HYPO|nr:heterokaryon incompatibility protein-domain-containing protein [Dactylonectria macrodidyma]
MDDTKITVNLSLNDPGPFGFTCWDTSKCQLCSRLRDRKTILSLYLKQFAILGTTRDLLEWSQEGSRCNLCAYVILDLMEEMGRPENFITDANFIFRWNFTQEPGVAHSQISFVQFEMSWGFPSMQSRQVHMNAFTLEDEVAAECVAFRPPNPLPASPAAAETARNWIETCERDHPGCRAKGPTPLPTRVLEISGTSAADTTLRLLESHGQEGRYVALSYVWGDPKHQYTTVKSNLAAHKEDIEFDQLPYALAEAVMCTLQLGLKYLWVDALCIIQDSPEDKVKEIAGMSQVYKNAWVTVSAAMSTGATVAFMDPRPELQSIASICFKMDMIVPKDVKGLLSWIDGHRNNPEYSAKMSYRDEVERLFQETYWYVDDDAWDTSPSSVWFAAKSAGPSGNEIRELVSAPDIDDEPINKRGWTLQESWLSRRMLIYGSGQVVWQCGEGNRADGSQAPSTFKSDRRPYFSRPLDSDGIRALSNTWRSLVRDFSKRQLGDPADKLNAMQGIVHELEEETGDKHYAGIWESDPITGLSWFQNAKNKDAETMVFNAARTCPSWSWAKVDGPVSFSVAENVTASVEGIKITKNEYTGSYPLSSTLVVEGEVLVRGKVSNLEDIEGQAQFQWLGPNATAEPFSNLIYIDGCLTNPDFKVSIEDGEAMVRCDKDFKYLELSRGKWDGRQNLAAESRGLLLVAADDRPNTYRRIGFFIVALEYDADSVADQQNLIMCLSVDEGNPQPTEFGKKWTDSLVEETLTLV